MAPSAFAANQKATVEGHNPGHTAPGPLPNFHQVHPYLFRGGQPDRQGVDKLHVMGIKTVIDLRAQTADTKAEKAQVEGLGMRYIILPMSDKAPSQKQVDTFIETTSEAKAKGEPVYVHCAHGSDRTGCMVGIWRVSQDGFSYDQAYKEMRQYYFGPQFKQLSQAVKQRATK
jgi:protein tyrosine/serine phosphatase